MPFRSVSGWLIAALLVLTPMLPASPAAAQQPADAAAVGAASAAFYAALSGTDAAAMHKVWAKTPYAAYVGPRSKSVTLGWDEVKKAFDETFANTSRTVAISGSRIEVRGNVAWEIGTETGALKGKDGAERKIDVIVTNIYEKIDGQWLMVSHHAQPKPQ